MKTPFLDLLVLGDQLSISVPYNKDSLFSQMKYISMLHRYLKETYPKQANTKFAGGLMLIQLAKELYDMHSMRLPL